MLAASLLFVFGQARTVFFNSSAAEGVSCDDSLGCNIQTLNSSLDVGDSILCLESIIADEHAKLFLDFLNQSLHKNISLIGAPTLISNPGLPSSEHSAIFAQNCSFSAVNISFEQFKLPVLNGVNSTIEVNSTTFSSCECTASALIAFSGCTVRLNHTKIFNNTANTQSFFVGMSSDIEVYDMELSTNFMESKDIRAAIHLLASNLSITNSAFSSNTMKLPLLASSNESKLIVSSSTFQHNKVICAAAMEFDSTCTFYDCQFRNCHGAIAAGGQNSTFNFTKNHVQDHNSDELLVGLTDSDIYVSNITLEKSTIVGGIFNNIVNTSVPRKTIVTESRVVDVTSKTPLITAFGGYVEISDLKVKRITSSSEIIVFSHQNGISTNISSSKFSRLTSSSGVSAGVSVMNVTSSYLESVKFSKNTACGCLLENTTASVKRGNFTLNQCFPQGNSLPIAILTTTLVNGLVVEDSFFKNNTALTGSLFLMNVTGKVSHSTFHNNHAVQGAAIFGAGMNISVSDSSFDTNDAMALGGVASLVSGNASFVNCDFLHNSAPEGAVISAKENYDLRFIGGKVRGNNGTNATFINGEGANMKLVVKDIEVDDEFSKAIWLDRPESADFSGSKFNCRVSCQTVGTLTPRPKSKPKTEEAQVIGAKQQPEVPGAEDAGEDADEPEEVQEVSDSDGFQLIWLMFPLSFLIAAVLYKKLGVRGLSRLFTRLCRNKRKRDTL